MKYLLLPFVVLVMVIYFVMRQRLPIKLKRFNGRKPLSIEKIHEIFYPDYEMGIITELWNEIASNVEVSPELIRPTDRFDVELGPVKGFPIAGEIDDLEDAFTRRCKDQSVDFHKVKIETVDDYIKLFAPSVPH